MEGFKCTKCGNIYFEREGNFYKRKLGKDGYDSKCKNCAAAYQLSWFQQRSGVIKQLRPSIEPEAEDLSDDLLIKYLEVISSINNQVSYKQPEMNWRDIKANNKIFFNNYKDESIQ